jgi:hypothetical protein
MINLMKKDFIFNEVNKLKGVGPQLTKYLKKKKIFETWFVSEALDLKTINYKDWVKKY